MILRFCFYFYFIALLVLFTACQQDNTSQPTQPTSPNPTIPKPDSIPNIAAKVFTDNGLQGSLTQQTTTNLLQNGDFESLEGWTACSSSSANDALVLSDDAQNGAKAGFLQTPDSCFYQSVSVSAGDTVSLSCYAKLVDNSNWTGLGVSFSDSNWQLLSNAPDNEVRGNVYRQYVTSATAPANTKYASLWVYTGGKVLVDNCQLIVGPPIIPAGNLLLNPSFEDGQEGWFSCGDASKINLSTGAAKGSQSIEVKDGGCLYQDLRVLPDLEYKLTCQTKQSSKGYATLIFSFLDPNWSSIKSDHVVIDSSNFANSSITLKAPANTKHAAATFYSETPTLYDDCSLTNILGKNIEIVNGGFEVPDEGWENCGVRSSQIYINDANRASEGNGFLKVSAPVSGVAYSCFRQTLPAAEGQVYTFDCDVAYANGTPAGGNIIISSSAGGSNKFSFYNLLSPTINEGIKPYVYKHVKTSFSMPAGTQTVSFGMSGMSFAVDNCKLTLQ